MTPQRARQGRPLSGGFPQLSMMTLLIKVAVVLCFCCWGAITHANAASYTYSFKVSTPVYTLFNTSAVVGVQSNLNPSQQQSAAPSLDGGGGGSRGDGTTTASTTFIPYTYARAARGTVPTIANPFMLIDGGFGLNHDGKVVMDVKPIASFRVTSSGSTGSSPNSNGGFTASDPTVTAWLAQSPSDAGQRVMGVGGGVGAGVPFPATTVVVDGGGGGGVFAIQKDPTILQQTILAPSRVFLYARVVAKSRVPSSLLDRLGGYQNRAPAQWTSAEIAAWCTLPALASGRIHPLTGGRVSYVPQMGSVVQTVVYVVQCSEIPFSIEFDAVLQNGDGSGTSLENVQLVSVYAVFAGLEVFPFVCWLLFLCRNGLRGYGWIPSRRDSMILLSIFAAIISAGGSVAWVAALSTEQPLTENAPTIVSAIVLASLVIRDSLIFVLMPLIASGYGTPSSTLSLRIRAFILVSVVAFVVFVGVAHACDYNLGGANEATCNTINFAQVLMRTLMRMLAIFLLLSHIRKLSEALMVNDNPFILSLFFRYKSLRHSYFILMVFPIVVLVLSSSVVSWYNRFIVVAGLELEVAFFHVMCIMFLGAFQPILS